MIKKQVTLIIEKEQDAKLKALSEKTMAPKSALVRKAIDQFFLENESTKTK